MQSRKQAMRAICSVYILQILRPIFIILMAACVALTGLNLYLATAFTAWWLVFLVPLVFGSIVVILVSTVALTVARAIAPPMSAQQKHAAQVYVNNMYEVTGSLQTPKFMIAIKILVDLFKRRWQGGFIHQTTTNSVRLRKDFALLVTTFEQP